MKKLITALAILVVATMLIAIPVVATGHPTGNERRTVAACNLLPRPAARRECRRCVSRPVAHHFHPNLSGPRRCHLNGAP